MVDYKDFDRLSYHAGFQDGYAEAKEIFKRPQGEWIRISPKAFKCKDCNYVTDVKYPYCPICGDKMVNDEFSNEFRRTYLYDKNQLPIV